MSESQIFIGGTISNWIDSNVRAAVSRAEAEYFRGKTAQPLYELVKDASEARSEVKRGELIMEVVREVSR